MKRTFWIFFLLFVCTSTFAQRKLRKVYEPRFGLDMPLMIGTGIGLGAAQLQFRQIEAYTESSLTAFDRMDISTFDRGATFNWSSSADTWSTVTTSLSMAVPLLLFLDKKVQQEYQSVLLMGAETFLLTDVVGQLVSFSVRRDRPYLYNDDPDIPGAILLDRRARTSFFSRPTAYASALAFMTARIWTDFHPKARNKWLVWTASGLLPLATGFLRYKSGEEYPSDIIAGYVVGAGIGLLVPAIHKVKKNKKKKVSQSLSLFDLDTF